MKVGTISEPLDLKSIVRRRMASGTGCFDLVEKYGIEAIRKAFTELIREELVGK